VTEVIEVERLHKLHLKALERIFAAEIEGRLPLQSKAAVFKELEIMGYAEKGSEKFRGVTVHGWYLTHAGRLTYCMNCE
jgi:hypothetical protein